MASFETFFGGDALKKAKEHQILDPSARSPRSGSIRLGPFSAAMP
jgi:hypothetical protein